MAKTKVLVVVKTYPVLSKKYSELVCTAGFREDGSWIRVYPVPFRFLPNMKRYQKWQWVEFDLEKNIGDNRKESFRLVDWTGEIVLGNKVGTENNWSKRKQIAFKNVYTDMSKLIDDNKNPEKHVSLAVLKPKEVIDFVWEKASRDWDEEKVKKIYLDLAQVNLFDSPEDIEARRKFRIADKIPYEFSYVFTTEDGQKRKIMIEDWEVGELYRHCIHHYKCSEEEACQKVRQKFFDDFAKTKDLYFFMGTTAQFDGWAKNPFVIIGTFTPKFSVPEIPSLFSEEDFKQ